MLKIDSEAFQGIFSYRSTNVYYREYTNVAQIGHYPLKVCAEKYKQSLCPLSRYKIRATIILKKE